MITDLLNSDEFLKLVEAINANKDYKLAKDGLTIESKSTDNSLQLNIKYEEPLANKEADAFKEYLNTLDDEVFVMTCESLGSQKLQQIQECINSQNLESVRLGIKKFNMELQKVILSKIDFYKKCLNGMYK